MSTTLASISPSGPERPEASPAGAARAPVQGDSFSALFDAKVGASAPADLLARAAEHVGADKKSAGGEVALVRFHEVGRVTVRTLPLAEARAGLVRHGGQRS